MSITLTGKYHTLEIIPDQHRPIIYVADMFSSPEHEHTLTLTSKDAIMLAYAVSRIVEQQLYDQVVVTLDQHSKSADLA